jgi:hypothetical protein
MVNYGSSELFLICKVSDWFFFDTVDVVFNELDMAKHTTAICTMFALLA